MRLYLVTSSGGNLEVCLQLSFPVSCGSLSYEYLNFNIPPSEVGYFFNDFAILNYSNLLNDLISLKMLVSPNKLEHKPSYLQVSRAMSMTVIQRGPGALTPVHGACQNPNPLSGSIFQRLSPLNLTKLVTHSLHSSPYAKVTQCSHSLIPVFFYSFRLHRYKGTF